MKGALQEWSKAAGPARPRGKNSPMQAWSAPKRPESPWNSPFTAALSGSARATAKSIAHLFELRVNVHLRMFALTSGETSSLAERAAAAQDPNVGIRLIYRFCLDQIETRRHTAIANLFRQLDVSRLSVAVMLAPLSITVPVASKIPGRSAYFNRVAGELAKRGRTDLPDLLSGLD